LRASLDSAIAKGGSLCLSVRPSVRHTLDPRLNYSRERTDADARYLCSSWSYFWLWLSSLFDEITKYPDI